MALITTVKDLPLQVIDVSQNHINLNLTSFNQNMKSKQFHPS